MEYQDHFGISKEFDEFQKYLLLFVWGSLGSLRDAYDIRINLGSQDP